MPVKEFFDPETSTLTHVVFDGATRDAVVIDPVLDFDPVSAETGTSSAEKIVAFANENALRVHYVLDTHAHADHVTGAQFLKTRLEAAVVIGARITEVQKTFQEVFDLGGMATDGSQFDGLVRDSGVRRPRLSAGRASTSLHHHDRRVEAVQHPASRGDDERRVRAFPPRAGRDLEGAAPALSERATQRERRAVACDPRERTPLSDDSAEPVPTRVGRTVKE